MIRAHLAVQYAVDVRPLAELNLVIGLATTKKGKKRTNQRSSFTKERKRKRQGKRKPWEFSSDSSIQRQRA